jgi:hypothetical protein
VAYQQRSRLELIEVRQRLRNVTQSMRPTLAVSRADGRLGHGPLFAEGMTSISGVPPERAHVTTAAAKPRGHKEVDQ